MAQLPEKIEIRSNPPALGTPAYGMYLIVKRLNEIIDYLGELEGGEDGQNREKN
jgi:hypothetical protein